MPALKKIYKDEPEKLKETASANLEFYNTNPQMLPFITSSWRCVIMIKVSQIHAALRWHLWDPYQESETRLLNLGLPPYFQQYLQD